MKYILAYALVGVSCFALSLILIGVDQRKQVLNQKSALVAGLIAFLFTWPVAFLFVSYVAVRRQQMLHWMAKRYQARSRLTRAECWDVAVVQFDQIREWGELTLFPSSGWNEIAALDWADEDMSCWDES